MSKKSKGIQAERELVHKFNNKNWSCVRVAGSGSSKYPSPDLLTGNGLRRLAIECKTCKDSSRYVEEDAIRQLKEFSDLFGAEPWIAVKFDRKDWLFLSLDDLEKTGKNYLIDVQTAEKKGLLLDEFIV